MTISLFLQIYWIEISIEIEFVGLSQIHQFQMSHPNLLQTNKSQSNKLSLSANQTSN